MSKDNTPPIQEATDEQLLRGKWTVRGVDEFPRHNELMRMIRLLEQQDINRAPSRRNRSR